MTSFLQIFPLQHCKHFLFLSSIPCSSHLSLDFIILIILCNNKSWYFTLCNFLQCMLTVVRTKMSILLSLDWVGKKIHILRQKHHWQWTEAASSTLFYVSSMDSNISYMLPIPILTSPSLVLPNNVQFYSSCCTLSLRSKYSPSLSCSLKHFQSVFFL